MQFLFPYFFDSWYDSVRLRAEPKSISRDPFLTNILIEKHKLPLYLFRPQHSSGMYQTV